MRLKHLIALLCALLLSYSACAAVKDSTTGRRVALIIGNGDYINFKNLPKLKNPPNDADDIANSLKVFGFEIILRKDLTLHEMNTSIAEFGRKIADGDAALFYFAGHGIQVRGQNYLMPVDAKIASEAAVSYEGVDVNRILDEMDISRSNVNIVMLDACRNNPITGKFRSGATRGLASPSSQPKGTVIVYATDPGNVAEDGDGRNGLFTSGLLTAFKGKDLSLDGVLTTASMEVEKASEQKQTPYVNGPKTLQKKFNFAKYSPIKGDSKEIVIPPIEKTPIASFVDHGCAICPEMIVIPSGRSDRGSPVNEVGRSNNEGPMKSVEVKSFALAKTEITRGQFAAFAIETGYDTGNECVTFENGQVNTRRDRNWRNPGYRQDDNYPAVCLSWHDAQAYVQWLSKKSGHLYRLPSEAEWEYAARAGAQTARHWGNNPNQTCDYANGMDATGNADIPGIRWETLNCQDGYAYAAPVGSFKANEFGLHDMLGNVWEWTEDCIGNDYSQAPTDGSAWTSQSCAEGRAMRGGSWFNGPRHLRAAARSWNAAEFRYIYVGFRPARTLP